MSRRATEDSPSEKPLVTRCADARDELVIRSDVDSELKLRGWTSATAILEATGLDVFRQVNGRENCRTTWTDSVTGRTRTAYIKRYTNRQHPDAAWDEAAAIKLCQAAGVPCLEVLAAGRVFDEQGVCSGSVLMTEAISENSKPLEASTQTPNVESHSLFVRFQLQNFRGGPTAAEAAERLVWLGMLAKTVKRLHAAQLTHGDLYLQHAFPQIDSEGRTQIALIDLQMLRMASGVLHWYMQIKDLWQLRFSLDRLNCDASTVRHWYESYFAEGDTPKPLVWWQHALAGLIRISSPRRWFRLWRLRRSGKQEAHERSLIPFYRGDAVRAQFEFGAK